MNPNDALFRAALNVVNAPNDRPSPGQLARLRGAVADYPAKGSAMLYSRPPSIGDRTLFRKTGEYRAPVEGEHYLSPESQFVYEAPRGIKSPVRIVRIAE